MFRNYKKCYCMNNNYKNNSCELQNDMIEEKCSNVSSYEEYGVFPENPSLAQSYVPFQYMDRTFKPNIGLKMGTIFPELVSPYVPCQDMEEQRWIESTNEIGKGCNKCR